MDYLILTLTYIVSGIVTVGFAPLGSPGRTFPNKEAQPVLLNDPVLKKIADKRKTTVALVSSLITNVGWGFPYKNEGGGGGGARRIFQGSKCVYWYRLGAKI